MESIGLIAQVARTRRFTLGVPRQFTVTPDESAVLARCLQRHLDVTR